MVARVQFLGILVFSSIEMRCPLSLMYDGIFGTCGFRCRSISWEIFSVGPSQPLTIGLTAMGFLCIFLRKYSCWVRGGGSVFRIRCSLVVMSMLPSSYIECIYVLMASVSGFVGSAFISVYMLLSERCSRPSLTYWVVSSITMPEPLSALFYCQ